MRSKDMVKILAAAAAMGALGTAVAQQGSSANQSSSAQRTPSGSSTTAPNRAGVGQDSATRSTAGSRTAGSASGNAGDSQFLMDAIHGNLAEIQLGQLAKQKGATDGVRDYGDDLQDDHQAALKKATDLAKKLNVSPPTEPTADQKREYDMLAKMSGTAFDQAFLTHMVTDHQKNIQMFQQEAQANKGSDVADYAEDVLPKLRDHLATAEKLAKKAPSDRD
jgi:putative membrane protein